MSISLLLQSAAAAASAGMSCGVCCGAGMGSILSGYLLTHTKKPAESFFAFLIFLLGKTLSAVILCIGASLIGRQVLEEDGTFFGIPVKAVVDTMMILMGVVLLRKWFSERTGEPCRHCEETYGKEKNRIQLPVLWVMGLVYGMTPCAPLLMVIGYATILPVGYAASTGGIFALSSAISPLLILFLLSGALAVQMYREIPQYLHWFQLGCYLLLTGLFTVDLIRVLIPFFI